MATASQRVAGGRWEVEGEGWRVEGEGGGGGLQGCRWQSSRWQSRFGLGRRWLFGLDGWWSGCFEVGLGRGCRDQQLFRLVTRLKHLLLIRLTGSRDGYWLFCGVNRRIGRWFVWRSGAFGAARP